MLVDRVKCNDRIPRQCKCDANCQIHALPPIPSSLGCIRLISASEVLDCGYNVLSDGVIFLREATVSRDDRAALVGTIRSDEGGKLENRVVLRRLCTRSWLIAEALPTPRVINEHTKRKPCWQR